MAQTFDAHMKNGAVTWAACVLAVPALQGCYSDIRHATLAHQEVVRRTVKVTAGMRL